MKSIERYIYLGLLVLSLGYIVILQTNKTICPEPPELVKVDTGYIIQEFISTWEKPQPDTIILPARVVEKIVPEYIQVPGELVVVDVDTAAILIDYYSKAVYKDTLNTPYASIYLTDTVTKNRIQARQWSAQLRIPEITRVEQLSLKKRNEVYAGFAIMSLPGTVGGDVNFAFKNKKDQLFEIGIGLIGSEQYYRAGTKFKISFKKD